MVSSDNKSSVNFQCNDVIELCLSIEKEGMVYYEKAAKFTQNPKVQEIFNWLANEEKEHGKTLRSKAKFLQPALQKKSAANEELDAFLAEEVKGKIFPLKNSRLAQFPEPQSDIEAVDFGIESEKRSITILTKLLECEKKIDVRVIFSHLLVEEKKHLIALEELKKELLEGKS